MTTLSAICCALTLVSAPGPIKRGMHPAISPDGATILFSWQGDIWSVPSGGGRATRLTVHPAMDYMPKWFPDGSRIVFSSSRYGNYDLFSMKPDGGDIQRITYESSFEYPNAVSPDGAYVYGYTNAWGRSDLFRVPTSGGDLVRLTGHPLESEYLATVSRDGKRVFYCTNGGGGSWRNPKERGSSASEIWVGEVSVPLKNQRNVSKNPFNDMYPLYSPDGTIVFMSNRSGWPNLWRMKEDGSNPKQLTNHTEGTLRMPSISADGTRIAYEFESEIWMLDSKTGQTNEVRIEVPDDQRSNPVVDLTLTSGLTDYSVAPDSKRIVIAVRGDLFLIPERGGTTKRLTTSPSLENNPQWIDPKTVLFVTGRNRKKELMTVTIDGEEKLFKSESVDVACPVVSPDRKQIAYVYGGEELRVMPTIGGASKTILKGWFVEALQGNPNFSWSSDSKHLVVEMLNSRGSTIQVCSADGSGTPITVARLARGASATPRFLPNGKGVYFTAREFDDSDLFVVDLVPADVTFSEDDLDGIDSPKKDTAGDRNVEIYEPEIFDRMRRLTTSGASSPMATADSKFIWCNISGQLVAVPVSGGAASPVPGVTGTAIGMELGSNQKFYMLTGGRLASMAQTGQAPAAISYSANMTVNLKDEERSLFDEIWWALGRFYYNPEMNGVDWKRMYEKFAKIVPHAFDRSDFYALMGEMMEEIDSSHLGATSPSTETSQANDSTGSLGVEWDWAALDSRGEYVVATVWKGTPASHPSSLLKVGDRIITVDGQKIDKKSPIAMLLNRKPNRKVKLGVVRGGQNIEVLIKPGFLSSRNEIAYENWVAWQRAQVEKLSGGKLTYHHVQGMNEPSYQRFLREIRTLTVDKKGVIFDVRYNGGGSTAHQLLGVLVKTPWLIRTSRFYPGERVSENIYRGDSLELPSALLINQASFSNAEIMAEGFRKLKIGPIIGVATAGGVIGTSAYGLWDGGMIRMPSNGAYAIDGENLEGNGRKPDFAVPFDPNAWNQGRDTQLEKAVEELMKRIS